MFAAIVEAVTGVQKEILMHAPTLDSVSVAQRTSWAVNRKTTHVEEEDETSGRDELLKGPASLVPPIASESSALQG
ncbi:hypothetical protein TRAPUB_13489 [Trametes pubescens]|uniref:Uncharacterized protein n=1 Tax=Trametes pubescens TaxID=154538 RepID=A0A1M2VR23_TRAPU|nr:hypothetical protein TRAPUB_13489 [Trametes pubescens]